MHLWDALPTLLISDGVYGRTVDQHLDDRALVDVAGVEATRNIM
jgi:hypothetical protein